MKTQYDALMDNPEFRRLLAVESLIAEASEMIARTMSEQKVNKAELARRLGKSRAWVTQLLSGKANMTVRTLAEVAYALDAEIKLDAQPPRWNPSVKTRGPASQAVVFKMDDYKVEPSIVSEDMFRLRTETMRPANEELAVVELGRRPDSEYAA